MSKKINNDLWLLERKLMSYFDYVKINVCKFKYVIELPNYITFTVEKRALLEQGANRIYNAIIAFCMEVEDERQ